MYYLMKSDNGFFSYWLIELPDTIGSLGAATLTLQLPLAIQLLASLPNAIIGSPPAYR
jgi:hypothetical protein